MKCSSVPAARRGIIAPLAAIFVIFMAAMVAFGVDFGWVVLSQTNLQNAADAAALSGAHPLMNAYVQYQLATDSGTKTTVLTNALSTAKTYAKNYASYNSAGNISSLSLLDADIQFGYMDSSNNYTAGPPYNNFPNTIKVLLRLDGTANGSLGLFFGRAVSRNSVDLTATASATIYAGTVNTFTTSSQNTGMLPLTYDVNHWNSFLSTGKDPDGTITKDANGVPQLDVYPSLKFPGNFGQLSLNDSHVGDSTEKGWVTGGMSSSDVNALIGNNLIPLSQHTAGAVDWQGDTGLKASLIMTINDQVNKTYLLPLFQPVNSSQANYQAGTGQGSNYYYDIVQFVGVRIQSSPDYNGQVWIQPAAVIDPNAVFLSGSLGPAGTSTSTTISTTFTTPKLTR